MLVKDLIKYFLFAIIFFSNLLAVFNQSQYSFPSNLGGEEFILSGRFILIIVLSSILFSHFSIRLTVPFSLEPFWRFDSKNIWFLKSYIYPLFSSTLFIALFTFVIKFGFKGIVYFIVFYLAYLLATKSIQFRFFFLMEIVLLYFMQSNEKVVVLLIGLSLVVMVIIERIYLNILNSNKTRELNFTKNQPIIIIKEISYFIYYSSEEVYTFVAIVIFFYIVFFNINSGNIGNYSISVFAFPAIAFLSFSQTLINLFGMDTNAVKMYFYNHDKTIEYLVKRIRLYQYFTNFLCVIFLVIAIFIMNLTTLIIPFILGVIIFNELMLSVSIIISIIFIEKKNVKWKFGQYAFAKSVNLLPIILGFLIGLIHYCYKYFNIFGLFLLVIISIYFNIYQLKSFAVKLMHNRILNGKKYV